ncbi:MAG TPA: KpsF/GutQ family sugar-phosphate isomerase [Chlamydiales bacterium]|jgi:arabinose-5-phosphate isomerase
MSRFKALLAEQKLSLDHFFEALNLEEMEKTLEMCLRCKGSLVLSGVGKSGLIAQKISATLVSTGTKAFFLAPSDALHGDIGALSENDLFLAFSKSGESQELLDLLPYVQSKGVKSLALVSTSGSRLAKMCQSVVYLPVLKELCPYDLAPTLSTTVQLLFGDALAIALMQARGFSVGDFAANHPAGLLGKKITLRAWDIMRKGQDIPLCRPSDRLMDVLAELSGKRCGCLVVVDDQMRLEGIFTDGDLRRSIQTKGPQVFEARLSDLMTKTPRSIDPQLLALDALRLMEKNSQQRIVVLPVLEGSRVVGLLHLHDILQAGLH